MRTIRVTIEPSRSPRRVWLKAVASDGYVEIVDNIAREQATQLRNKLLEKLTASGRYDEVIGDPIPDPRSGPRKPWERKQGEPDRP